jgi:uncharacterized protein YcbK (DUF882 family)
VRNFHRRDFLKLGAGILISSVLPVNALASVLKESGSRRTLSFYHTHTAERLRVCYFQDGTYQPESLEQIDHILRDHRTGDINPIDPELLDQLYAIYCHLRPKDPFHVISAFRSQRTNEMLRGKSRGVASKSFHTQGKAIDIRLPNIGTKRLRNFCISLHSGGVGYYSRSNFLHIDTGPVRSW